ncbi:endonuclease/exonuclease/phosphatase family protein [Aurantiacibacter poecillastricola]|uniref:endonuclease/exonuclease/phosphatase family protein n=1 Tax=Aurantiacibacter poecillastricola TaxID=3064385 RepID=UPI00273DBE86|nr:endonuclease/exonuclease/phosphatase family protein [Aurantiacibacter sp. 219JJ12-13]MDP5260335.1 endonuclease/exonuclease/phosphatase family protein [Aurantiacibacter sp. 219JJ12-13]
MQLTFASYNIHKGVGSDRRRDPGRILRVLEELDADIVALQEVDHRFGSRRAVLDREELEEGGWSIVSRPTKPASMGWHGNALLVRERLEVLDLEAETLPQLEPRGALRARLGVKDRELCITAMHLDLSGLRRKRQFAHLCNASRAPGLPAVMLGDCNEWVKPIGGERGLAAHWTMVEPGPSFPARRPLLPLDRVLHSSHWQVEDAAVHNTALSRKASDHLPIRVTLSLHDS